MKKFSNEEIYKQEINKLKHFISMREARKSDMQKQTEMMRERGETKEYPNCPKWFEGWFSEVTKEIYG